MNFIKRLLLTLLFKMGMIVIKDDEEKDVTDRCFIIGEDGLGRLVPLDEHERKISK